MKDRIKKVLRRHINGIPVPKFLAPKCVKEVLEYKPIPGDVFIHTYPKCGSNWIQNVALYIFRKGREVEKSTDFLKLIPFIDMLGMEGITNMPRPGAFKTQIPYSYMPYSTDAKYIFVARNPKDCCVSFFHHARRQPGFGFWDGEFNDFFECFIEGDNMPYGDFFDHLLDWYPHRKDPNVFYTKYEDMKRDIKDVVLNLAKFLGKEYIEGIEKDNSVLCNIIEYSGFEYMKNKYEAIFDMDRVQKDFEQVPYGLQYMKEFVQSLNSPRSLSEVQYVYKGNVGSWKNHFSAEQNERLNKKFLEKMKGTEVLQWYPVE
ncbi:sulfotransferase 1C2A [Caerostris darwini]|uniref:Sulfotransferase 1C2A n=1 Tax=Caerostris darwini TaxID=1538125 RepID=A0AAV4PYM0_9ARAC|nr:sulfotransferase 1C2A [Caerostris darwini]